MKPIVFFDTEIEPKSRRILDIGSIKEDRSSFHSNSVADFIKFLQGDQSMFAVIIFSIMICNTFKIR